MACSHLSTNESLRQDRGLILLVNISRYIFHRDIYCTSNKLLHLHVFILSVPDSNIGMQYSPPPCGGLLGTKIFECLLMCRISDNVNYFANTLESILQSNNFSFFEGYDFFTDLLFFVYFRTLNVKTIINRWRKVTSNANNS